MNKEQVIIQTEKIISELVKLSDVDNVTLTINDKLHIILSESSQALSLVTTLEDEFDITFEDDEIDLDFFLDSQVITGCIYQHLMKKEKSPV